MTTKQTYRDFYLDCIDYTLVWRRSLLQIKFYNLFSISGRIVLLSMYTNICNAVPWDGFLGKGWLGHRVYGNLDI